MLDDLLVVLYDLVGEQGDVSTGVALASNVEGRKAVAIALEDLLAHVHGEQVQEGRGVPSGGFGGEDPRGRLVGARLVGPVDIRVADTDGLVEEDHGSIVVPRPGFFSAPGLPPRVAGLRRCKGPTLMRRPVKDEQPVRRSTTGRRDRSWDRYEIRRPKVKVLDGALGLAVLLALVGGEGGSVEGIGIVRGSIVLGEEVDIDVEVAGVRLDAMGRNRRRRRDNAQAVSREVWVVEHYGWVLLLLLRSLKGEGI